MSSTTKVLAVIGESQHGKSSFINMISGTRDQAVGTGDGKSCTSELNPTKIRDHLRLYGNGETKINCDDLPGFGDTGMRMTNGQILESMKIRLAGLERRELDALLVFQSLAESRFELAKTFARLEEMFGPEISQSAIVILTKSDLVVCRDLKMKLSIIADILSPKNIPSVMWVNDSLDELIEETQKREQAASLRAILAQVRPYQMMNMREYERRVEERARQLMAQDKSNTVAFTITVPTSKIQMYKEIEAQNVPRVVSKYSEAQVKELALQQAHSQGFMKRDPREYEDYWRNQYRVAVSTVWVEVEKARVITALEAVVVTTQRHDIDHYRKIACKEMTAER